MLIVNDLDSVNTSVSCSTCRLNNICLPKGLKQAELVDFDLLVELSQQLPSAEIIIKKATPFKYLYAIKSGSFKEYVINFDGKERIIDFYLPGEIIGLDAISQKQHNYTVSALEKSTICQIDFSKLVTHVHQVTKLQLRLLDIISQKLFRRSSINNQLQAEQRIAAFLIDLSKRNTLLGQSSIYFQLNMTRNDIGNYLNLTPETICRIFSKLKLMNIIDFNKRHILLKKPDNLVALL